MSGLEWEVVDGPEPEPLHGPRCGVHPGGHTWTLTIEQGQVLLTSGCDECDDAVLGSIGIDVLELRPITGRLEFEHEHPPDGCPYLFDICDHGYWWTFVRRSADGAEEAS